MINFVVVGRNKEVIVGVLQAIRSFTDAKAVVVGNEETKGLRWSNLCERHSMLRFDGSDDDKFVAMVGSLVKKTPHMVLIPADGDGIRLSNRVRSRLPLKIIAVPDSITFNTLHDTRRFHQFCKLHLLNTPAACFVEDAAELDFHTLASQLGLPFTIQPAQRTGAPRARLVHNKEELEKAAANEAFRHGSLICQRHIDGIDISMSLLADRGQISAFSIQHSDGSRVRFASNAALEDMAARLCRASAYHGPMHLDARIDLHTGEVFLMQATPHFPKALAATVLGGLNIVAESIEPTPRHNGMRRLTAGLSHACHPIMRPSLWSHLLFDSSERGRLLRVMTFDVYTLGDFACRLPGMALRKVAHHAAKQVAVLKGARSIRAHRPRKGSRDMAASQVAANFVQDF